MKKTQLNQQTNATPFKDWPLYLRTSIFGLFIFAASYSYTHWMKVPGELNKSMADTATILIGFSMLLTSICYFWNFLDWSIIYRKYLGLIGFAFALAHILLSWDSLLSLLQISSWQQGKMWPALMGAVALFIFTIMATISNSLSMRLLGVIPWKRILRTGYIAIILVGLHVVLLKSGRWMTWYQGGMKTMPSLSLITTIFLLFVVGMRGLLEFSLRAKKQTVEKKPHLPSKKR